MIELTSVIIPSIKTLNTLLYRLEQLYRPLKITTSSTLQEIMMNEGEQRVINSIRAYIKEANTIDTSMEN